MDSILDIAISSGLGIDNTHIKINDTVLSTIPYNTFGVFVSVKRSKYQKLSQFPEDIHGCIGQWDNKFQPLPKKKVLQHIKDVSYSATWNDNRKNSFSKPIYLDSHALYEIDFMLGPVMSVTYEGVVEGPNVTFDNNIYGLIVVSGNNKATYLPKVFTGKSWEYIRDSLLQKGSVSISKSNNSNNSKNSKNVKFYAYNCKIVSKSIYQLLSSNYLQTLFKQFTRFLSKNYTSLIPYSITRRGEVITDKSQYVRNIATICDILSISNKYPGIREIQGDLKKFMGEIKQNLMMYKKVFLSDNTSMRQASGFLIMGLHKLKLESEFIETVCRYLYQSIHDLEPRFELGEVLIALATVCPKKKILIDQHRNMYQKLKNVVEYQTDDIFQYNWESKYLLTLYLTGLIKFKSTSKTTKTSNTTKTTNTQYIEHFIELSKRILNISKKFYDKTETNYLAVAIESLSSIYYVLSKINLYGEKHYEQDMEGLKVEILDNIIKFFYLTQKKKQNNGLYYFNDNSARLDITGHITNGLLLFL